MKKRILFTVLSAIFMMGLLVGCKSDAEDTTSSESNAVIEYETPYKICSLCEESKICGTYVVNEESYIVCEICTKHLYT